LPPAHQTAERYRYSLALASPEAVRWQAHAYTVAETTDPSRLPSGDGVFSAPAWTAYRVLVFVVGLVGVGVLLAGYLSAKASGPAPQLQLSGFAPDELREFRLEMRELRKQIDELNRRLSWLEGAEAAKKGRP
jgi:hypothetical protein